MNLLLKDQGFLYGEPGAYGLTPKGMEFGVQQSHDNGYGGSAFRSWETTHFAPTITDALDSSAEELAKARDGATGRRDFLRAERMAAQAENEARFQDPQAGNERSQSEQEIDMQKVLLMVAVSVAAYGVYKGVQWIDRKRREARDLDDQPVS